MSSNKFAFSYLCVNDTRCDTVEKCSEHFYLRILFGSTYIIGQAHFWAYFVSPFDLKTCQITFFKF